MMFEKSSNISIQSMAWIKRIWRVEMAKQWHLHDEIILCPDIRWHDAMYHEADH